MPEPAQPGRARVCDGAKEERAEARRRVRNRGGVLVIRSYLRCYARISHDGIGGLVWKGKSMYVVLRFGFALVFGRGRLYVSKKREFA
jgi:hypothetical protein